METKVGTVRSTKHAVPNVRSTIQSMHLFIQHRHHKPEGLGIIVFTTKVNGQQKAYCQSQSWMIPTFSFPHSRPSNPSITHPECLTTRVTSRHVTIHHLLRLQSTTPHNSVPTPRHEISRLIRSRTRDATPKPTEGDRSLLNGRHGSAVLCAIKAFHPLQAHQTNPPSDRPLTIPGDTTLPCPLRTRICYKLASWSILITAVRSPFHYVVLVYGVPTRSVGKLANPFYHHHHHARSSPYLLYDTAPWHV